MALKTTIKYIQSGESTAPNNGLTGLDLAQGNLGSGSSNFLPTSSIPQFSDITAGMSNGVIDNISNIKDVITGSITNSVNESINSIGNTITSNVNAISASINGVKQDITDTVSSFNDTVNDIATGGIGKLVDKIIPSIVFNTKKSTDMSLSYPETLKNVALNPAHIHFQFYDRNTKNKSTSIHLPMPDNISNPSTINWESADFGMMGTAAVKGLQSVKNGKVNQNAISAELNSMAERVKSVAFYSAASEVVNGLGGNQLSADDLMGATSGKMTNPYKTFLFRGVNFRTFNFKFNLVPLSESDCDLIDKIINKFREHSYPDFAGEKMFFTYPDECQINYMWESGHNKWLNSFKRAVCNTIDVDFAPLGQWAGLRNGFPYMIVLNTTWTEVEIITKDDIRTRDNQGQRN